MTQTTSQASSQGILPAPDVRLPVSGAGFQRADADLLAQLAVVSSATASAMLHRMGIRQTFIQGPTTTRPGSKIVGSIITLQFMPQREDVASGIQQEYAEKYSALWAVLETVLPGDVLTIQAYGDPYTGCLGEMLITYFKARGGVGIVVDGYVRDYPRVKQIDVPLWTCGFTPNYASQASLFPWAYNVPIACSRVLVLPGDIMIADDDGAVVVPRQVAPQMVRQTLEHEDWEAFSRLKMQQGGALGKYYPLSDEGRQEYEQWRQNQRP
ncbi:MAG: ribonuclease activity regulator RraA [Anaerolineae bacterium]|jgi:regulator of RNase E activity RraA|nr:ribonuclease activity regulator RraA [Anaerolineae bacterium]